MCGDERDRAGGQRPPYPACLLDAWAQGQKVSIHGWVYGLKGGRPKTCRRDRPGNAREVVDVFPRCLERAQGVVPPALKARPNTCPNAWIPRGPTTSPRR